MDERTDAVMGGHGHMQVTGGLVPFYKVAEQIVERLAALTNPDIGGRVNHGHLLQLEVVEIVRDVLVKAQAQGLVP